MSPSPRALSTESRSLAIAILLSLRPRSVLVLGRFIIWLEHLLVTGHTLIVLLSLRRHLFDQSNVFLPRALTGAETVLVRLHNFHAARDSLGFVRSCSNLSLRAWQLGVALTRSWRFWWHHKSYILLHTPFRYFCWHRSDDRCKSIYRSIWEISGSLEGFLTENVSVTLLIKMLLSSYALFACIMSLKEILASKHMGISMGKGYMYQCRMMWKIFKASGDDKFAGCNRSSRIYFWGSNRIVIFVRHCWKWKHVCYRITGIINILSFMIFLKLHMIFLLRRAFVWANRAMERNMTTGN